MDGSKQEVQMYTCLYADNQPLTKVNRDDGVCNIYPANSMGKTPRMNAGAAGLPHRRKHHILFYLMLRNNLSWA